MICICPFNRDIPVCGVVVFQARSTCAASRRPVIPELRIYDLPLNWSWVCQFLPFPRFNLPIPGVHTILDTSMQNRHPDSGLVRQISAAPN